MAAEDATVSGMAGRYASALFELALENSQVGPVQVDLGVFDALIAGNPDLLRLVRSPVFGADEQEKALAAVLDKAGIGGIAAKFLGVVTGNRRLFAVPAMIEAFLAKLAERRGEVAAEVTTAQPLSDSQHAALSEQLRRTVGRRVSVDVRVDPALIGGLVVKVGSRMIDGSLRSKLQRLQIAMKGVG